MSSGGKSYSNHSRPLLCVIVMIKWNTIFQVSSKPHGKFSIFMFLILHVGVCCVSPLIVLTICSSPLSGCYNKVSGRRKGEKKEMERMKKNGETV